MLSSMSTKNKTLLFIFIILIITFTVVVYTIHYFQSKRLEEIQLNYFQKIEDSYTKNIVKNLQEIYVLNAKSILNEDVLEAFYAKDRQKVYDLVEQRYKNFKIRDPYFEQMHFHLADGTSFLRMHKPTVYGENIAELRPMVASVHKDKEILFGYEMGLHALSYRVFVPAFFKGEYIGALEFGISPKKILDIVIYFNNLQGLLYLNQQSLTDDIKPIQYTNITDEKILKLLKGDFGHHTHTTIIKNGEMFCAYSFYILDLNNKKLGELIFINDLTSEYKFFITSRNTLFFIFVLSGIFVFLIINYGFENLISKLEDSYEELKRFTSIVDNNVINISYDLDGNVTYVSKAFLKISGYSKDDIVGKKYLPTKHSDIWECISSGNVWSGEIKNTKKNGDDYWVYATVSPVFDKNGYKIGYTSIREDISDKKRIEEIAITDSMTDVYNRRYFNEMLPRLINTCKRENDYLTFIILDVDFFKQYNDTYGHKKGDTVLIQVAHSLRSCLNRGSDYLFRIGGEEFCILIKGLDEEKSFAFADKLRQKIEDLHIEHSKNSASAFVTASFGVVVQFGEEIENENTIYTLADEKLYQAKEDGRNRVCI
ncbi:MAG: diguanylate cyclase [Arcobacteraceae bacterium]|nr:diguanylate cyclase [Arcobacteraceae bacterium]